MGKNSAAGNKAYIEVRRNGGSKEEARAAQKIADAEYYEKVKQQQFGKSGKLPDNHDPDSSINDGSWHTSEDL